MTKLLKFEELPGSIKDLVKKRLQYTATMREVAERRKVMSDAELYAARKNSQKVLKELTDLLVEKNILPQGHDFDLHPKGHINIYDSGKPFVNKRNKMLY